MLRAHMEPGYGASLLSALLALGITAGLSYLLLRFLPARRWLGRFSGRGQALEVEEILRVDEKSSLLIVRVEGRRLLLATHRAASTTLVAELQPRGAEESAA